MNIDCIMAWWDLAWRSRRNANNARKTSNMAYVGT